MTIQEITDNIASTLKIDSLNEMQQKMLKTEAKHIALTAPTGSGKTLAFTIRMLLDMKQPDGKVQSLVLAPSRELVIQINDVVRRIAKEYKTVAFYGGHSMTDETNSLSPTPDIIIATPGRMLDHLQRGHTSIDGLNALVLDEYDKSLELGFETEMRRIISRLGKIKNIILTSATSLDPLPDYLNMKSSVKIEHLSEAAPRDRMSVVEVKSFVADKLDTLIDLLHTLQQGEKSIVFVNHRESAERVYQRLIKDHIPASLYHGALDQQQREMAIDLFRNGTTPTLVATDLAARGLDIAEMENVVHYHLPVNQQAWTHRNGRTARVDSTGSVWVITSEKDNIPDYVTFDRQLIPDADTTPRQNESNNIASLYIGAGKKEKISKGDIAGYVSASGVTAPDRIGMITIHDHYSIVAVPRDLAHETAKALNLIKLKGKKVKASVVKR